MNPTRHPDVSLYKPPADDLFELWRIDIKPLQDAVPSRRNNIQAPDPSNPQNLPQINLYFGNKKGNLGLDSSSPEDRQRGQERSPSPIHNSKDSDITIREFLDIVPAPNPALIDIDVIRGKFIAENFLDSPLSWLKALPRAELKNDFSFTMAEKGWLCSVLEGSPDSQHRLKRARYH
ncbi:MAG TPA: hypothetical protein VGO47_09375 [Chlamydiales bacterium]|nr:hypothetical protein [Chlamydiales bacterium]